MVSLNNDYFEGRTHILKILGFEGDNLSVCLAKGSIRTMVIFGEAYIKKENSTFLFLIF